MIDMMWTSKVCPCFDFADVNHTGDTHSSKNFRLQQTIEAAIRDPTTAPPQPTFGTRTTGWEPLLQTFAFSLVLK